MEFSGRQVTPYIGNVPGIPPTHPVQKPFAGLGSMMEFNGKPIPSYIENNCRDGACARNNS